MREFLKWHVGRFLRDQGGNFAILTAVAMLPVLVATSVAIDHANASLTAERMQVALDSATLVAVRYYGEGHSEAEATTLANDMFFANFTDAAKPSLQIVYSQAGQQATATADYALNYDPVFLKRSSFLISRHSSTVYQAGKEACILALNPTADRAIDVSGSSNVDTSQCAITANSRSSQAIYVGGSATLKSECLYTPGKISASPSSIDLACDKPYEGATAALDPFRLKPMPQAGSRVNLKNKAYVELNPGTYNGLDIKGTVKLQPGDYIIDGGKLSFAAQSVITGEGVTFFLLNGAEININGGSTFNVTAPTSGPWAGFSIVADRSNTASAVINGNSNSKLNGIIYMPAAKEIQYSGNGTTSGECVRIIAQTITMTGNSKFKLDCKSELANNEINNAGAVRLVK
jgi:Putative Flp pilus-assembly TadE/G-like